MDHKDSTTNISYEDKGIMKISNDIIVPDYLVSLLIGKNGETIRGIMGKSGSMITFQKEVIIFNLFILLTFYITKLNIVQ
jgi:transcription antitermination factor NusA-like protein